MLRLVRQQAKPEKHEDLFLSRYDQVLTWALQLTNQDQQEAEDLAQDAFIDFVHSRPELNSIRNINAYLYTFLRNLHRSRLHRYLRRRDLLLSVIDYDSVETGLNGTDPGHFLQVWDDLYRVCLFACERKETSKAGSILILRFFHGYSSIEVALILRTDRSTVDTRLSLVRKEARLYLEEPGKIKSIEPVMAKALRKPSIAGNSEELICELQKVIFEAKSGTCLSKTRLKEVYRADSLQTPDITVLAHVVSCPRCLDAINQRLGLPLLSDRGGDGMDSDGNPPATGPIASRSSRKTKKEQVARWRRLASGVAAHYPRELVVAVNGIPLAWQEVLRDRNEFSLRVQQSERVEFIEILTEQGVRLLSLLVAEQPPEGPGEARNEVALSDGRCLSVSLRFETLWPVIHISYSNMAAAPSVEALPAVEDPSRKHGGVSNIRFDLGLAPAHFFRRRLLSTALALSLILALLFYQTHETTLSAATLLAKADAWERTAANPGLVTHRVFDLEERASSGPRLLSRRRVEVWHDSRRGSKLRRLFDSTGKLLASSTSKLPAGPLRPSNVWEFEPSAGNFRLIAGEMSHPRVLSSGNSLEVAAQNVVLTLDPATFQPTAETVLVEQHEYRFSENSFETVPILRSPLADSNARDQAPRRLRHIAEAPAATPLPSAPTAEQLENAELAVRTTLHDLKMDLTRSVDIRRNSQEIEVAGVVDSAAQRNALASALSGVPNVRLSVLAPEEAPADGTAQALLTSPGLTTVTPALLHTWIEQRYPAAAARRAYIERVVSLSDEALRRAYALLDIADRYSQLDRAEMRSIAEDHQKALTQSWNELRKLTSEVMGASESPATRATSPTWPSNAKALAKAVETFDRHLLKLFTDDASPAAPSGSTTVESELKYCREAAGLVESMLARPLAN